MSVEIQSCFHCGLPVIKKQFQLDITGVSRQFCCTGCLAAASMINSCGLADFYKYRESFSDNIDTIPQKKASEFNAYNDEFVQQSFVTKEEDNSLSFSLQIEGITCAACVWLIEHSLTQLEGISQATLNLSNHRLSIILLSDSTLLSDVFSQIQKLGYGATPWKPGNHEHLDKLQKDFLVRLGIAGIGMMQVMMNTFAMYLGNIEPEYESLLRWASLVLTLPVFFYAALPFYKGALRDLKSSHFGMDIPVSLALILSFIPSVWATIQQAGDTYYESVVMFTFFLLLGRYLEFRARKHLDQTDRGLDDLIPIMAHRIDLNDINDIPSQKLLVDDVIEVRPGELIPTDGIVIFGTSQLNEASITGEFHPVLVTIGQHVRAGTINTDGLLRIKVTQELKHSSVSQMMKLLERAAAQKPKIAELADRGASYFVILVLILSLLTGVLWIFIDASRAFWIAISVLVVTCPCALSLATPVSLTSSISALRRAGVLPANSKALTELTKITTVIFDKTGTLTRGKYTVSKLINHSNRSDQELYAIAAALESHSEHPIGKAFSEFGTDISIENVTTVANQGIAGFIDDDEYRIGTTEFCLESSNQYPDNRQWITLSNFSDGKMLAWFCVQDILRPDALDTITALKEKGLDVCLLTGDPSSHGNLIAAELGIDTVKTGMTAAMKVNFLENLHQQGCSTLMVGDGINDAPALSLANVSIAMSEGTELTKQSADILLLGNRLISILTTIENAFKTNRIIKQNLTWGLFYNIIALPFAMSGLITPWMAAIGMSFSSLLVVINALRLTRKTNK